MVVRESCTLHRATKYMLRHLLGNFLARTYMSMTGPMTVEHLRLPSTVRTEWRKHAIQLRTVDTGYIDSSMSEGAHRRYFRKIPLSLRLFCIASSVAFEESYGSSLHGSQLAFERKKRPLRRNIWKWR